MDQLNQDEIKIDINALGVRIPLIQNDYVLLSYYLSCVSFCLLNFLNGSELLEYEKIDRDRKFRNQFENDILLLALEFKPEVIKGVFIECTDRLLLNDNSNQFY